MGERLISIQVLRAVAAFVVVFAHLWPYFFWVGAGDRFPNFILGAAGVDLFFVISGFVMVYTAEPLFGRADAPWRFFTRRLARIVPLYWLATTLVLVQFWHAGVDLASENLTLANVAASYFFVPLARPNGGTEPIVGVGWTLDFEMFFYVVFAVAALLPRRRAVIALTVFFWCAIHLPRPLSLHLPQPFLVWFGSTIYEFAFGMWIALAFREGLRLPRWLCAALLAAGIALLIRTDWDGFGTIDRVTGWGGGAALIVAGCVLADAGPAKARFWLALAFVGDASYALYLLHGFVLDKLFRAGRFIDPVAHVWLYAAAGLAIPIALAIVVHIAFERPATALLKSRLRPRANGLDRAVMTPSAYPDRSD